MINTDFAEICGLHAGDGYLRNDGKRIELDISGNVQEKDYYDKHVIPLFSNFFNISIKGKYFKSRNTYGFVIRNKKVVEKLHSAGFPYGKKTLTVKAPQFILESNNKKLYSSFLRGLFDTDGSLSFDKRRGNYKEFNKKYHVEPRINITTVSKKLSDDMSFMLNKLKIRHKTYSYNPKNKDWNTKYTTWIRGKKDLNQWMDLINPKNPIQLSRYQIWLKYGFNPPYTTYEQREDILNKKLNPYKFYGPVA